MPERARVPGAIPEEAVERAREAVAQWFHEHPDGASSDEEWRDFVRTVLEAVWPRETWSYDRALEEAHHRAEKAEAGLQAMQVRWSRMVEQSKQHVERAKVKVEAEARLARYTELEAAVREYERDGENWPSGRWKTVFRRALQVRDEGKPRE